MRKKYGFWGAMTMLAVAGLCAACRLSPTPKPMATKPFVDEVRLRATPVGDQGRSELCWMYAMVATIETERLMKGDSVRLSVDWPVRHYLEDKVRECYLSDGRTSMSLRGMGSMALRLIADYGLVSYDAYHADISVNYHALCRRLRQVCKSPQSFARMTGRATRLLDEKMGYTPRAVYLYGAEYTPHEFARSVCPPRGFVSLTSFTHHPFGRPFVLEVPDNRLCDTLRNVPIDTLMTCMERAIRQGHPVCWEGDISEPGFLFSQGVADLPANRRRVSQWARQRAFERRHTTDDHCMALVGLACDAQGRRWFIAKNSWGTDNPYKGYMYLSYEYILMKTIAVYLSYEAYNL